MEQMQMTVKELYKLCKSEINKGNGDKNIVISDDIEGNGYHGLFYGFTEVDKSFSEDIYDSKTQSPSDTIILG